jgi:hypothetical protein
MVLLKFAKTSHSLDKYIYMTTWGLDVDTICYYNIDGKQTYREAHVHIMFSIHYLFTFRPMWLFIGKKSNNYVENILESYLDLCLICFAGLWQIFIS